MTRKQAETFTENLSEMVFSSLATKEDIKELNNRMKQDISHIDSKIDHLEERLNNKIDQTVNKLTIKLDSLMAIGLGMMSFIIKFSN